MQSPLYLIGDAALRRGLSRVGYFITLNGLLNGHPPSFILRSVLADQGLVLNFRRCSSILHHCDIEPNITSKYAMMSKVRHDEKCVMTSRVHHGHSERGAAITECLV